MTREAGLGMDPMDTKTLGVAVLDYDGDGRPDLFFVNDRVSNRLFHNRGDGTFEETTAESGAGVLGERPRAGMGIAVGDPAGDGLPTLFVTNFGGEPNSLYRNVEGTLFEDAGEASGAARVGLPFVRWGTHFADFDNDGWPDLYAVGGHLAPRIVAIDRALQEREGEVRRGGRSRLSPRRRSCSTTSAAAVSRNGRRPATSRRSACRDAAARWRTSTTTETSTSSSWTWTGRPVSSRTSPATARAGSAIEPRAGEDGRTVLGTKVKVTAGGRSQTKEFYVSPSYASGTLTDLHFGLGDAERVEEIVVTWPGGRRQEFHDVAARKIYRLRPGGSLEPR